MTDKISPKYLMKLADQVEKVIWAEFSSYKKVRYYIDKWHEHDDYQWENFSITTKNDGDIDLVTTLHRMPGDILLKLAIDLGVETPDFIPCVPQFKNELKETYKSAFESFQKAIKQVEEHPDIAIGLANSTLESIIKEIHKDSRLQIPYDKNKTLYQLTEALLKQFKLFPEKDMPNEIRNIGSALLNVNKNIETLRSEKTILHGKTSEDYVVEDSMYAYFVINSVSTLGLFINSFYKIKFPYPAPIVEESNNDDLPF